MSVPMSLRRVNYGGRAKAHMLSRLHGKTTLCGRRASETMVVDQESPLCAGCEKEFEHELQRGKKDAERREALAVKAEANRDGTFVVYRCKLCGVQHFPASRGTPWCYLENHVAVIEAIEVQGPAHAPTVNLRSVA